MFVNKKKNNLSSKSVHFKCGGVFIKNDENT